VIGEEMSGGLSRVDFDFLIEVLKSFNFFLKKKFWICRNNLFIFAAAFGGD
jgi:hypothetical protein